MADQPIYRCRREASEYLRNRFGISCAPSTLAKFATLGGGPKFVHAGRYPLYPETELDAWALSRISPLKASTSDAAFIEPDAPQKKIGRQIASARKRRGPPASPWPRPTTARFGLRSARDKIEKFFSLLPVAMSALGRVTELMIRTYLRLALLPSSGKRRSREQKNARPRPAGRQSPSP